MWCLVTNVYNLFYFQYSWIFIQFFRIWRWLFLLLAFITFICFYLIFNNSFTRLLGYNLYYIFFSFRLFVFRIGFNSSFYSKIEPNWINWSINYFTWISVICNGRWSNLFLKIFRSDYSMWVFWSLDWTTTFVLFYCENRILKLLIKSKYFSFYSL